MAALAYIPADRFTHQQVRRTAEQSGLLGLLAEGPATRTEVQQFLCWPVERCRDWLRQLESAGLVEIYDDFIWSKTPH